MILPVAATAPQAASASTASPSVVVRFTSALEAAAAAPTDLSALATFRATRLELATAVLELGPADWWFLRPKHLALLGYEV